MNLLNTVVKVKTGMAVWETEWFYVVYSHDGMAVRSFGYWATWEGVTIPGKEQYSKCDV